MIDIRSNAYLYRQSPKLVFNLKGPVLGRVKMKQKTLKASIFRMTKDKRSWQQVTIRDSSKGLIVAEFLHERG